MELIFTTTKTKDSPINWKICPQETEKTVSCNVEDCWGGGGITEEISPNALLT